MTKNKKPLWTYTIIPGVMVLLLILVFALDNAFQLGLNRYGLHPRDFERVYGLFTFFFLHGSVEHLLNNIIGFFVLSSLLRYYFPTIFFKVMAGLIFFPAVLTFFIASEGVHIGASGTIYALAVFLFVSSLFRLNRYLIGLSLLIVFLYGGLWWGIFPIEERVSWEGHLSGTIVGFLAAIIFYKAPINVEAKEPSPKFESEDTPDIIGDQWKTNYQVDIRYIYTDENDPISHSDDTDDRDNSQSSSAVSSNEQR